MPQHPQIVPQIGPRSKLRRRACAWALAAILVHVAGARIASAATGDATLSCPATIQPGQQFVAQLSIDAGTLALGAYSVTFAYNTAVATIASVAGGNTAEFANSPTANSGTFTSGSTIVSGL